jgi:hypothetical protein
MRRIPQKTAFIAFRTKPEMKAKIEQTAIRSGNTMTELFERAMRIECAKPRYKLPQEADNA